MKSLPTQPHPDPATVLRELKGAPLAVLVALHAGPDADPNLSICLPALKEAPLSILYVLATVEPPDKLVTTRQLAWVTDFSEAAIIDALARLHAVGLAHMANDQWRATTWLRQLAGDSPFVLDRLVRVLVSPDLAQALRAQRGGHVAQ